MIHYIFSDLGYKMIHLYSDSFLLVLNKCALADMFTFLFVSKKYRSIALKNQNLRDNLSEYASINGYLGILSWAHKKQCISYEKTLCTAIYNGHLDIVIWATKNNLPLCDDINHQAEKCPIGTCLICTH